MMRAAITLFVFRVSISFCKNVGFLAISSLLNEIVRWSVSMTSTISASDLLKFFASLVFMVFVDTVGDMLIDLAQSDLELMTVVQHYRNLVAFLVSS